MTTVLLNQYTFVQDVSVQVRLLAPFDYKTNSHFGSFFYSSAVVKKQHHSCNAYYKCHNISSPCNTSGNKHPKRHGQQYNPQQLFFHCPQLFLFALLNIIFIMFIFDNKTLVLFFRSNKFFECYNIYNQTNLYLNSTK